MIKKLIDRYNKGQNKWYYEKPKHIITIDGKEITVDEFFAYVEEINEEE